MIIGDHRTSTHSELLPNLSRRVGSQYPWRMLAILLKYDSPRHPWRLAASHCFCPDCIRLQATHCSLMIKRKSSSITLSRIVLVREPQSNTPLVTRCHWLALTDVRWLKAISQLYQNDSLLDHFTLFTNWIKRGTASNKVRHSLPKVCLASSKLLPSTHSPFCECRIFINFHKLLIFANFIDTQRSLCESPNFAAWRAPPCIIKMILNN